MKINHIILNIPPFISTSWKNIISLHVEDSKLVILLKTKDKIVIPNLEGKILEQIFAAHSKFIEEEAKPNNIPNQFNNNPFSGMKSIPAMKIGPSGIESLSGALAHNPEQKNAPDLPPEMIEKITAISKVIGVEDKNAMPKPEPHCNCFHCQIAKALQKTSGNENFPNNLVSEEDIVSEEDLKFRSWDIKQVGENLYTVVNPLDLKEQYNVFLGKPIGCTCGEKNCEHLRAVLNS